MAKGKGKPKVSRFWRKGKEAKQRGKKMQSPTDTPSGVKEDKEHMPRNMQRRKPENSVEHRGEKNSRETSPRLPSIVCGEGKPR